MPKCISRPKPMEENKSKDGRVALNFPMLTKSNYTAKSMRMSAIMKAHEIWEAVEPKDPKGKLKRRMTKYHEHEALGETVEEGYVLKKLLRAVPARFLQITSAIEQFGKIEEMSLEEAVGSLKAHEERAQGYGHFAAKCHKPKKERDSRLEANLVQVQDDDPALLFNEADEKKLSALLLNERDVMPKLNTSKGEKAVSNIWYLDNDASNHTTGELGKFKELDYKVTGKVKFGNGSTVEIKGKGVKMVFGLPKIVKPESVCSGCLMSKQSRKPFPKQTTFQAKQALGLVHADLCGPISPDEALNAFKKFKVLVEKESKHEIKVLRTDRGGELCSKQFLTLCEEAGISRHYTAPYTSQQNGVVERHNRTVIAMAHNMLKEKRMPSNLWGGAVTSEKYYVIIFINK
ncbi:hypothetical protein AgCh_028796 [Apium graveolens]